MLEGVYNIYIYIPRVSIVVPFVGLPVIWLGSYNRDLG